MQTPHIRNAGTFFGEMMNVQTGKSIFRASCRSGMAYQTGSYAIMLLCGYLVSALLELALLGNWQGMYRTAIWTAAAVAVGGAALYFLYRSHSRNALEDQQRFRNALYRETLSGGMQVNSPGEWNVHLSEDAGAVAKYWQETLPVGVSSSMVFLCSGIILTVTDWRIGGVLIALALMQLLPVLVYEKWARQIYRTTHINEEAYNDWMLEGLNGALEIRAYGAQAWYLNRFRQVNTHILHAGERAERTGTVVTIVTTAVDSLLNYGSYLILGAFVLYGGTKVAQVPLLIVLARYVFTSVNALISLRLQQAEYQEALRRLNLGKGTGSTVKKAGGDDLLQAQKVEKAYGEKTVLRGASLTLGKAEKLLLQGENGSGKSTLLRIILGLEPADKGSIALAIPQSDISYSLQEYPELQLCGADLLAAVAENCPLDRTELNRGLAAFGVEGLLEQPLGELSQGQRKKVSLALALAKKTPLLILDEPTNHLDGQSVQYLCRRLACWKGGLILCTHDHTVSLPWDRKMVMVGGQCHEQ